MTRSIQVITRWERFKRLLVWHPINTDPTDDDRWTVRVWLPLYDCLAVLAGITAHTVGSPILNRLFPNWVVDLGGIVFGVAGAITLTGVIIPKLYRAEIVGKIMMSFMLTTYAFLVLAFPSPGVNTAFVTVILVMATWGIYPRLTQLFARGVRARMARKAADHAGS